MTNREIVKKFVSDHWSDEKICAVMAFNQDGKMKFSNTCSCIIGVHTSDVLHDECCSVDHYSKAKKMAWSRGDDSLSRLEEAYACLSAGAELNDTEVQEKMDEILHEVLAERIAERETERVRELEEVSQ